MNDRLIAQLLCYQQINPYQLLNTLLNNNGSNGTQTTQTASNGTLLRPVSQYGFQAASNPIILTPNTTGFMPRIPLIKPEPSNLSPFKPVQPSQATNGAFFVQANFQNNDLSAGLAALTSKLLQENKEKQAQQNEPLMKIASNITEEASTHRSVTGSKDGSRSPTIDENEEYDQDEEAELRFSSRKSEKVSGGKKIKKKRNTCGHTDRKHYAKGLCSLCYHKKSRDQKPKLCPHDKLYARDLCQKCYAAKYRNKGTSEEVAN